MRQTMRKHRDRIVIYLILFAVVLPVLIHVSPMFITFPSRDSGVFMYIGKGILSGNIPYRDYWDHKGPVIYFINALGMLLMNGSAWGVWLLEVVSLFGAAVFSYEGLRRTLGKLPAAFGTILWVVFLPAVLPVGNFTEEFSLFFQFLLFLLFVLSIKNESRRLNFALGIVFGLTILLKPSNTGVEISVFLVYFFMGVSRKAYRKTAERVGMIVLGTVSVLSIAALFFYLNGALGYLWDEFIRYNFVYISSGNSRIQKLDIWLKGVSRLNLLATIGAAVWFIGIFYVLFRRKILGNAYYVVLVILIDLPIELLFSAISDRRFTHYFILWLPTLGMHAAFFAYILQQEMKSDPVAVGRFRISSAQVITIAFLVAFGFMRFQEQLALVSDVVNSVVAKGKLPYVGYKDAQIEVLDYLENNTSEDDYVFMWGNEVNFNFVANRRPPSRYMYIFMFFKSKYITAEMIAEFKEDILTNKPLLIDTSTTNTGITPFYCGDCPDSLVGELRQFLSDNYELETVLQENGWGVYRFIESQ